MKQTVYKSDFCDQFRIMGRLDNFSYEAREMLFDFLEEINEDAEMDVVAVCCEYSEDSIENIVDSYDIDISDCECGDEDSIKEAVLEYLNDHTSVIGETYSGSMIVYAVF